MTQSEYAKRLKVSRQYIGQLVQKGVIKLVKGAIVPEMADQAIKRASSPVHEETRKAAPGMPEPGSAGTYREVVLRKVYFEALLRKVEYEERSGKLVAREEVEKVAFETARKTRDALNAITDRMAHVLAAVSDPVEVAKLLRQEIRQVEEELANAFSGGNLSGGVRQRDAA